MPFSFSKVASKAAAAYSRNADLAEEPDLPWNDVPGPLKETLLASLLDMYWDGVSREVRHILLSLSELRQLGFSEIEREYRHQQHEGFEHFLDQTDFYREGFGGDHGADSAKLYAKAQVREQIKKNSNLNEDLLFLRARVLLQAAGFLDIDKLVEYRDPPPKLPILKKGMVPQLKLERWNPDGTPEFSPAICAICKNKLRGVLFQCRHPGCAETPLVRQDDYICEKCFRGRRHSQQHLVKTYKHHILDELITPEISRELCQCSTTAKYDPNGNSVNLYPISHEAQHRRTLEFTHKCKLFQLPDLVREAKFRELVSALENKKQLGRDARASTASIERAARTTNRPIDVLHSTLEEALDADVPRPLRGFASKFPLGNTHVALMIGPLIIENGVARSREGVLFRPRDPSNYYVPPSDDKELAKCFALSGDKKNLFTQYRIPRRERRLKACMKQIVGGAFASYFSAKEEDRIIQSFVDESQFEESESGDERYLLLKIRESSKGLLQILKRLLSSRITVYLQKITTQLLDPKVVLTWNFFTNNCHTFCDAILRWEDFGGLFAHHSYPLGQSLYLMSFVVRPECYGRTLLLQKRDVPNGFTEEYLLGFRAGRHDDSDIVDTLQEYWHDWGAFRNHLYKYQDVFPWDCTEAYNHNATKCNRCTLSKHVWAFPFDSFSVIQLHLTKKRRFYAPGPHVGQSGITDTQWMENRFKIFLAHNSLLCVAVAMAQTASVRHACDWFRTTTVPQRDRLKLGGIHRAQPFSHHFERGRYTLSLLAPWVHLTPDLRVREYEAMRDWRKKLPDVPKPEEVITFGTGSGLGGANMAMIVSGAVILAEAHVAATASLHAGSAVADMGANPDAVEGLVNGAVGLAHLLQGISG